MSADCFQCVQGVCIVTEIRLTVLICSRKKGGPNFWATRIIQRLREGPKLLTASIKYQVNRKEDEVDQPEILNDPHESL